jgi:tetratricopeptide (TPR) repeat protein
MAKVKKGDNVEVNYANAMQVYDDAAKKYPQLKSWAIYQKANDTFGAEMDTIALKLYNDLIAELEPKTDRDRTDNNFLATAYRNGGYIIWATLNDSQAARPYFEKLIAIDPDNSLAKKYFDAEKAAQEAAAAAAEEGADTVQPEK